MNKQKIFLMTCSFLLLGSLPAMANLGNVWTNFQFYANDFQNYFKNNIGDTLKPIEPQVQTAISNSTGDLRIPNPNAASGIVKEQINQYSISEKFENNSAVRGLMVKNEIDRQVTRSSVEGVLGRNGQTRVKNKLQNTELTVANINNINNTTKSNKVQIDGIASGLNAILCLPKASAAIPIPQVDDSCLVLKAQAQLMQQDLYLDIANINIQNEQSKMISETLGTSLNIYESLQYSNLNLANISQQMDEVNRSKRVENSAEAARLLRATSQTDLLGRKRE